MATGRRPRVEGIGLETVGVQAGPHGIPVDEHLRAGERLWVIGDVNGVWPLTHVGEYEGDVVAANIAGDARTCCGGTAWSRGRFACSGWRGDTTLTYMPAIIGELVLGAQR